MKFTSSNPTLSIKKFEKAVLENKGEELMTMSGIINKSLVLLVFLAGGFYYSITNAVLFSTYLMPLALVSFVLALIITFKPKSSRYLGIIYAIGEGFLLGTISSKFEEAMPGITFQAVAGTFGVFLTMLFLYKAKILKATSNFKRGVLGAGIGIMFIYLISLLGNLTNWFNLPYIHENGIIGIGFSIFTVGLASLFLILDFSQIEEGIKLKAPKSMEWYSAFSLLVTLIWIYLEILKLISKSRSSDSN